MPGLCRAEASADYRRLRRKGPASAVCVLVRRRFACWCGGGRVLPRGGGCAVLAGRHGVSPRTISLVCPSGDFRGFDGNGRCGDAAGSTAFVIPGLGIGFRGHRKVSAVFYACISGRIAPECLSSASGCCPGLFGRCPVFRFLTASRKTAVRVGIGALFLVPLRDRARSCRRRPPESGSRAEAGSMPVPKNRMP